MIIKSKFDLGDHVIGQNRFMKSPVTGIITCIQAEGHCADPGNAAVTYFVKVEDGSEAEFLEKDLKHAPKS